MEQTESPRKRSVFGLFFIGVMVLFILAQFARFVVPGLKIENPPVANQIQWDAPRTQELWDIACNDCHSNETDWNWYAYIAPVGWLVARDVHEGRDHFNISERNTDTEDLIEAITEGEMPPAIYFITHPDADLSNADKQALVDGLQTTFGVEGGSRDDDDD